MNTDKCTDGHGSLPAQAKAPLARAGRTSTPPGSIRVHPCFYPCSSVSRSERSRPDTGASGCAAPVPSVVQLLWMELYVLPDIDAHVRPPSPYTRLVPVAR